MRLESNATEQIQKPIEDVFEGIVNPEKMKSILFLKVANNLNQEKK